MQKNVTPGRRKGCPNYPPEFKQQLVAASCEPGISISKLALENGINANLCKRLVRTVLIFTESSDQLSRATDRVPGLPASPGYVQ
ncbi:transposase [Escherichia coli]|uniref:transposase n=1 Tax=Escherichia coli TaxID=562 RepID=UPI001C84902C|nr:transposase [Escherichia coli]MBB7816067.1 transposase [Escherichia coli]QZD53127.1 transposase [Escherichia coli]